ncbi:MAG TPA: hypothetical protein PLN93_13040, partial [Vicinamibacterales bacterium]|nr:hypothetical protein [Vicinamibacterales bacterium]
IEFSADIGAIYFSVGAAHAREFEAAMLRAAELLAESRVASQREQAAGWRLLRATEVADGAPLSYVLWCDPAVKGIDYSMRAVAALAEAGEARRLEDVVQLSQAGPAVQAEYRVVMAMRADASASPAAAAGAPGAADEPATQAPGSPAQRGRTFSGDVGVQFNFVKADHVEAFEASMTTLRGALAASTNPVRRAQADSWRVLRQTAGEPAGQAVYLYLVDPIVTGADYAPSAIVREALGPEEARAFAATYSTAFARGVSLLGFTLVKPGMVDSPDVRRAGTDTGSPVGRLPRVLR